LFFLKRLTRVEGGYTVLSARIKRHSSGEEEGGGGGGSIESVMIVKREEKRKIVRAEYREKDGRRVEHKPKKCKVVWVGEDGWMIEVGGRKMVKGERVVEN